MRLLPNRYWRQASLLAVAAVVAFTLLAYGRGSGSAAQPPTRISLGWPRYGNDLGNTRYQNVDQVSPGNVGRLVPIWIFHTRELDPMSSFEASPIVVGNTMYVSTGHDDVFALNAATGADKWEYHPESQMKPITKVSLCCGEDNRGVTYSHGLVYLGRLDDKLVALNAATGRPVWQAAVADFRNGYSITMAPQVVGNMVIVGVSGGEYKIRGMVVAYDAHTGRRLWTFFTTLPGRTWANASWKHGGGPTWQAPAADPHLGLLYVTVGNTGNDLNGEARAGKNLYTDSIVALDLRSGKVRWYFQETHHDLWDYDSVMPSVLFDLHRHGQSIPALGQSSKDGYYFILNRRTGEPLFPVKEKRVPTTPAWQHPWPTQPVSSVESLTPHQVSFDPPFVRAVPQFTPPRATPLLIQPGPDGGVEYPPSAYSPRTHFVYYETRYLPAILSTHKGNSGPSPDGEFIGSGEQEPVSGVRYYGIYGAVNTQTGKVAWKITVPQLSKSGLLVAGNLVFFGENNGLFHAVDARTGRTLWTYNDASVPTAGGAAAAPIAYMVRGRELIANAFGGNNLDRMFQLSPLGDALIVFGLPGPGYHGPTTIYAGQAPQLAGVMKPHAGG